MGRLKRIPFRESTDFNHWLHRQHESKCSEECSMASQLWSIVGEAVGCDPEKKRGFCKCAAIHGADIV